MPPKRKANAPVSTANKSSGSSPAKKKQRTTSKPKPTTIKPRKAAKDVLSTNNLTEAAAAGVQANRKNCALLRMLPGEIRNKIWEYVLGGKTIHIIGDRQQGQLTNELKLKRYVCKRASSEEEDAEALKAADGSTTFEPHAECHKKCFRAPVRKTKNGRPQKKPKMITMNLGLLATCREIHSETALIPYTSNTFSFDYIVNLHAFIERLVPTQVEAVQRITYVYHESFRADSYLEKRLQEKLVGLKSLVFFTSDLRHWPRSESQKKCLLRFQRLQIESAKIVMDENRMVHKTEYILRMRAWEEDIEKKLMTDFDAEQTKDEYDEYDEDAMLMEEFAEFYKT